MNVAETPPVETAPTETIENTITAPNDNKSKSTPDWAQKRINELTAKRYEADRRADEAESARKAAERRAEELLAKVGTPPAPQNGASPTPPVVPPVAPGLSEEDVERRAGEKADQIARAREFNKACNNIVEHGKKDYKETWDEAIKNLNLVGAIGKDVSPVFLENAVELKDPHKVLHYLGTNIEEGERISRLSPTRMAMELARVEATLGNPPVEVKPPISNAPAPVIPVGGQAKGTGALSLDDPNLSADEWYALRARQIEDRKKRYIRP
jgi:hypothetical protein